MVNFDTLKQKIQEEIIKIRNLGEHTRKGSDHLYNRSISKLEFKKPKKVKYNNKIAFEVICKYDIYTETEFLHPPEMDDLYIEHYNDKFVFDEDYIILEINYLSKK